MMTKDYDENEVLSGYLAGLQRATMSISWYHAQRQNQYDNQFKMTRYTNKRVYETWGRELDTYMSVNYRKYNHDTKVEIVADDSRGIEWLSHGQYELGFVDIHDLSPIVNCDKGYAPFQLLVFYSGCQMIIAYVPEIDTLFIRTLFDITHTEVDPNDKMDIEAKLGL